MPLQSISWKTIPLVALLSVFFSAASAQIDSVNHQLMPDLVVKAFSQQVKFREMASGISVLGHERVQSTNPYSIVQAVNTLPGVRMEERSPGSYRINIRGSSIRSPFGIRNVKLYYNDIPITDPGGVSFLNQLSVQDIGNIEIIKGPGSSLYGAGTGGVMLIESQKSSTGTYGSFSTSAGSYEYFDIAGAIQFTASNSNSRIGYQRQTSSGYRIHSNLKRETFSWSGQYGPGERFSIKPTVVIGDLSYQTPGALTISEYESMPRAARPGSPTLPGSVAAGARIRQRHFLAGISSKQKLTSSLNNQTVLYGMFTELTNPNLRAYEYSLLPHFGGRTIFGIEPGIWSSLLIQGGLEWQKGISTLEVYKNVMGSADSIRSIDRGRNSLSVLFLQASINSENWVASAGVSTNYLKFSLSRYQPALTGVFEKQTRNILAPRLSIMRKFKINSSKLNVFAAASRGYSPPSASDLFPSGGEINLDLEPETGWNYEAGIKSEISPRIFIDWNIFYFSLENTIALRKTAANADYYINAGKTDQKGMETSIRYTLMDRSGFKVNGWISHSYHDFKYKTFSQGNDDFSGRSLPGVAPHSLSIGIRANYRKNSTVQINYFYSDRIPLNDGNSVFAKSYHLTGIQVTQSLVIGNFLFTQFIGGVDNLFNEKYSLGNDINGFGGRYYNAAPARNYYVSLRFDINRRNNP